MSSRHRKGMSPIVRMKAFDKKIEKLWKKTRKKEYEDNMRKWSILARQRNDFITQMLHFQTCYTMDSNAFMTEEMALPLEINLP